MVWSVINSCNTFQSLPSFFQKYDSTGLLECAVGSPNIQQSPIALGVKAGAGNKRNIIPTPVFNLLREFLRTQQHDFKWCLDLLCLDLCVALVAGVEVVFHLLGNIWAQGGLGHRDHLPCLSRRCVVARHYPIQLVLPNPVIKGSRENSVVLDCADLRFLWS